ncbi:choice-of-anchor D domain-containing protein [Burkholderia multivorans]|uniref:choice-of-anchor D domain-containing protein n=1 Tax=Burkholderia multivorans TaxID=87883 RepID=UPI001C22E620|nr:choice-of-anchor D domain-containing protein [Burkholderia multivorans]MBU9199806.1 choice-of-anchor D domain-containing protein [Burkholderia multivorans]MDN8079075.1 choice-of-anchor D domain-containing protein [Burkholderia multivorans]
MQSLRRIPSRLKCFVTAALLATSVSSFAASYYVVIPVPNRTPTAGNVMVSLTGYSLPAGQVGTAYVGFDFNTVLQVLGDPSFDPANVRWSVAGGALPAGLTLSSNGRLTGSPTSAGTASFQVLAAYKTKAGEQSYQLFVAKLPGNGTLSVTALNFGEQPVGASSSTQAVTLTNTGGDTLSVTNVGTQGPFSVSSTCPNSLEPNATCTANVTFTPTAMGPASGGLTISTGSGNRTVDLSGTGMATRLAAAPASVSFGNVRTDSTGTQSFTLTNNGNLATTKVSWSLPAGVTETDNCGQSLAPGASCTATLTWTPTTGDALSGTLTAAAQDFSVKVPLTGAPVCPGGTVTVSQLSDKTLTAPAACGHAVIAMWGAGGGGYSGAGGGGGYAGATVPVPANATLLVQTGQGGVGGTTCEYGSGECTSSSQAYAGGYGGGGSFVYINGALAMAAGGGGGGGGAGGGTTTCQSFTQSPAGGIGGAGGAGGGSAGLAGGSASSSAPTTSAGGGGGSQTAGGSAGSMPTGGGVGQAGYYLHGGPASSMAGYNYGGGGISGYGYWGNGASGAGGGGYYGGGSGGTGGGCSGGAGGGGGSGYVMPTATNVTLATGSGSTPGNAGAAVRGVAGNGGVSGPGQNGLVSITWAQ